MVRKSDIQYVRYTFDGNAARQLELEPARKHKSLPKPRVHKRKRITLRIDPLAIGGIVVAVVMATLMMLGLYELRAAQQQQMQMQRYIWELKEEKKELQEVYSTGYDLDEVRNTAMALGLVPIEELEQRTIQVVLPVPEPVEEEPTIWETVTAFFEELFA